jgi:hypothetical protein
MHPTGTTTSAPGAMTTVGHDPVLARADEESSQLLDDSPILLDDLEHARGHGLVTEQGRLPRRIGMEEREHVELAQALRGAQLECGDPGPHGRFECTIGYEWLIHEISSRLTAAAVISGPSGRGAGPGRRRPRP